MKEFLTFVLSISFIVFLINIEDYRERFDNKKAKYNTYLGERVVVNKDTLTIVDSDIILNEFKLSNGEEVSFDYVKRVGVVK